MDPCSMIDLKGRLSVLGESAKMPQKGERLGCFHEGFMCDIRVAAISKGEAGSLLGT